MRARRWALAAVAFAGFLTHLTSQEVTEVEFRDQPVRDVLLSIAELFGRSILPDETVSGTTSCYLHEPTLERTLAMLLPPLHLYAWERDGLIRVSRVRIQSGSRPSCLDVDADEVDAEQLLQRLSAFTGTPILCGELRGRKISVHGRSLSTEEILDLVTKRFPELFLERADKGFVLSRRAGGVEAEPNLSSAATDAVTRSGDLYSINASKLSFRAAVSAFMERAGREVVFWGSSDPQLTDLKLENKPFDEMLSLLLNLGRSGCSTVGTTHVVYDLGDEERLNALQSTIIVPLAYLSAEKVPALLPGSLSSGRRYRVDTGSNSIILSGKPAEIAPIRRYLEQIDRLPANREYCLFEPSFIAVSELLRLLPREFDAEEAVVVPGTRAFVLPLSREKRERLSSYLSSIDREVSSVPITLRYIRVPDLVARLPPGIAKEDLFPTTDPSTFFFVGDEKKQAHLRRKLATLDRPARQVRYELLVVQHNRGSSLGRAVQLSGESLSSGERDAFFGSIGSLLALKFDIVSAFGWLFAVRLNMELSSARARVLADTTLNGISGEQITFRNTNTYRYRDAVVNPDTGHLDPTGVVREITSGLIIGISGWVSGADIITMDITSTISAQGADTSGSATTLPPTSEKVITTHVRTRSGRPVVIGGLLERTHDRQIDGVPWLSRLPVVGPLFQKVSTSTQDTELSVYILPHVEEVSERPLSIDERLMEIYAHLVRGEQG